jgi:hypothetical protein
MRGLRGNLRAVVAAVVATSALAVPASAGATTYCVNNPACVSAGGTPAVDISAAFTAAGTDPAPPSTVNIGPGTYGIGSLVFNKTTQISVIGAGVGRTFLTTSAGSLSLFNNSGDLIQSLSLHGTTTASDQLLSLGGGTADGVDVSLDAPGKDVVAVFGAGTVKNSSVSVTGNASATGIGFEGGTNRVDDTTINAPIGLTSAGLTYMDRDRVTASNIGATCQSSCRFEDLLISTSLGASDGLLASCVGPSSDLAASNVTIVGTAAAGVAASCAGTKSAQINLDSSIISDGATHALQASTTGATASATIDPTYDDYNDGTDSVSGANTTIASPGATSINADPAFVNAAAGDYRIAYNSPARNTGNPAALSSLLGDSMTDLAGHSRVVDGRRDMGAFEYQHQPPSASITRDPGSFLTGQPVHFSGAGSSDPDGDALRYGWSFDDGSKASTATVARFFRTPGLHTVHLTVTDPTGLSTSGSTSVEVTPLALVALKQSHATWGLGHALATLTRKSKPPVGTRFTFKLNAGAARVRFVFTHLTSGGLTRGKHGKCVARTHANRGRPRCKLVVVDGTLSFAGVAAGQRSVHFEGRLDRRHTLKPGTYTVTVTAFDAAGDPTAPRALTFRVVRAQR